MCIIKNAIRHSISDINSYGLVTQSDPGELREHYRNEIDWYKVEQEVLNELRKEVVTDSVEAEMLHEVITQQVQTISNSEWFLNVVKRAQNRSSVIKYI